MPAGLHAASALPPLPWNAAVQGQFVMAMTGNRQGDIWLGKQDNGLTRFDPHAPVKKPLISTIFGPQHEENRVLAQHIIQRIQSG